MLNISPLYLGNGLFLFLFSKPRSSTQSYFVQCSSPHTCHHMVRMGPWWEGGSVRYFPSQVPKSSSPSMCDTQCWHKYFLCRSVASPGMSEWGAKETLECWPEPTDWSTTAVTVIPQNWGNGSGIMFIWSRSLWHRKSVTEKERVRGEYCGAKKKLYIFTYNLIGFCL